MNIPSDRECSNQNRLEDLGFGYDDLANFADFWGMSVEDFLELEESVFDNYIMLAERMGV